jgi:hypothetical protein
MREVVGGQQQVKQKQPQQSPPIATTEVGLSHFAKSPRKG